MSHALGLQIVMITGDNRRTAEAVAKTLGIDAVEAEIEPQAKSDRIQKLQQEGKIVPWPATASTTRRH